ncbi:MAG: hypothetical protein Q9212_005295 [Teloschistes hypoglaucus]
MQPSTAFMRRERFHRQSLGAFYGRIKQSRVLMVGAGGIGCELLKNLILTGFGEIHIVDLDTIDLSNLNRQFLFRYEHIKKPKALVAKESAAKFNPHVKLEAYHANIKDPQFNVDWFAGFNIVFNALDNIDARRHVNKMCLAADVPLIESGTTGFNGQVQPIIKGKSECYDCSTKATPKSFPVCTIRSTPSQPIHCIVWAKSYLFTEIFGTSEDDVPEFDHSQDSENAAEIENLRKEASALNQIRQSMGSTDFPRRMFEKVFTDDINRLRSMEDMWKTRSPPTALDFDSVSKTSASGGEVGESLAKRDQSTWTLAENFTVFCDSIRRLSRRLQKPQAEEVNGSATAVLSFDKDDDDTLDFVAASANMRSFVFGIESKSKFDIKQMAGNIIPAIATTNAMTAGLCVLQAFKVMRGDFKQAKMMFLERSGARVVNSEPLRPPNPQCPVCGVMHSKLVIDPSRATLKDLVEDVLQSDLGYREFSISSEDGTLYDPDLEDNLEKKFSELGVKDDSFLTVVDEDEENPRIKLSLSISEKTLPDQSKPVSLPSGFEIPRKPTIDAEKVRDKVNGAISPPTAPGKRKRAASTDEPSIEGQISTKRGKLQKAPQDDDLIVVEDNSNGAIVIDD